jgi:hypothetical protein
MAMCQVPEPPATGGRVGAAGQGEWVTTADRAVGRGQARAGRPGPSSGRAAGAKLGPGGRPGRCSPLILEPTARATLAPGGRGRRSRRLHGATLAPTARGDARADCTGRRSRRSRMLDKSHISGCLLRRFSLPEELAYWWYAKPSRSWLGRVLRCDRDARFAGSGARPVPARISLSPRTAGYLPD